MGDCVEVARADSHVTVRDSKDPTGPVVVFSPEEWRAFVRHVQASDRCP
jgi:hypothetical protein